MLRLLSCLCLYFFCLFLWFKFDVVLFSLKLRRPRRGGVRQELENLRIISCLDILLSMLSKLSYYLEARDWMSWLYFSYSVW